MAEIDETDSLSFYQLQVGDYVYDEAEEALVEALAKKAKRLADQAILGMYPDPIAVPDSVFDMYRHTIFQKLLSDIRFMEPPSWTP